MTNIRESKVIRPQLETPCKPQHSEALPIFIFMLSASLMASQRFAVVMVAFATCESLYHVGLWTTITCSLITVNRRLFSRCTAAQNCSSNRKDWFQYKSSSHSLISPILLNSYLIVPRVLISVKDSCTLLLKTPTGRQITGTATINRRIVFFFLPLGKELLFWFRVTCTVLRVDNRMSCQ